MGASEPQRGGARQSRRGRGEPWARESGRSDDACDRAWRAARSQKGRRKIMNKALSLLALLLVPGCLADNEDTGATEGCIVAEPQAIVGAQAQCGLVCPAGLHPVQYACSAACGGDCAFTGGRNQVFCEEDASLSFWQCGLRCPDGYRAAGTRGEAACEMGRTPAMHDNSALCTRREMMGLGPSIPPPIRPGPIAPTPIGASPSPGMTTPPTQPVPAAGALPSAETTPTRPGDMGTTPPTTPSAPQPTMRSPRSPSFPGMASPPPPLRPCS